MAEEEHKKAGEKRDAEHHKDHAKKEEHKSTEKRAEHAETGHKKEEKHAGHAKKDHAKEEKRTKKAKQKSAKQKPAPKKQKLVEIPKATDAEVADAFGTISFVLMTEKSVRVVEAQNKLVFIARRSARRDEIKKAVEAAFGSPVAKVTTLIDQSGRKKAFVKFRNEGAAGDIAIKLGVI